MLKRLSKTMVFNVGDDELRKFNSTVYVYYTPPSYSNTNHIRGRSCILNSPPSVHIDGSSECFLTSKQIEIINHCLSKKIDRCHPHLLLCAHPASSSVCWTGPHTARRRSVEQPTVPGPATFSHSPDSYDQIEPPTTVPRRPQCRQSVGF